MLSHRCRIRSVPSSLKTLALFAALAAAGTACERPVPTEPPGGGARSIPQRRAAERRARDRFPLPFL